MSANAVWAIIFAVLGVAVVWAFIGAVRADTWSDRPTLPTPDGDPLAGLPDPLLDEFRRLEFQVAARDAQRRARAAYGLRPGVCRCCDECRARRDCARDPVDHGCLCRFLSRNWTPGAA